MANYDDNAFNNMNGVGGDMYITGGSIVASEYENNMTPADQKDYEDTLMELFQSAYQNDNLMQKYPNVNFKHWLTTIDGDDWRERAESYSKSGSELPGSSGPYMYPGDAPGSVRSFDDPYEDPYAPLPSVSYTQDEQIHILQRLAHLHTGRIEDLVDIVDSFAGDTPAMPQGMPGFSQAPQPQGVRIRPEYEGEGGGDQGPF